MNRRGRSAARSNEDVLSFVRPPAPSAGAGALELVYQAAEIFSSIENGAREPCARAHRIV
jgi:hypothetical protein